jgi:TRAP transporter 4TM/12TM fusion protein
MLDTEQGPARVRSLGGWLRTFSRIQLIAIPTVGAFFILDIPFYLGMAILKEQYFGIFFALLGINLFLLFPARRRVREDRVPWYDFILVIFSIVVGLYITIFYPKVLFELGVATTDKVVLGTITIFLILEGVRRVTGWILVLLGLLFLVYGRFTWLFPGVFNGPGITWDLLSIYLFLDPTALLGLPMDVTAVVILGFVLFGNLLFGIGGGKLLTDMAMAGFGRFRGGPAKIAVVASSLFGMISGTAVSNVAFVGPVTIPLMKKTGYKPHVAGGIEAISSTGGQLMPPVMGVTAFIMAEFTGIPYPQIAISALLPSILYYLAVFIQVDLEAAKNGLVGIPREQLPRLRNVMARSWLFFIPLAVLVYTLFIIYLEPGKAALIAALSILFLGFFQKETRLKIKWIIDAFESTGGALLDIGVIVALAGIIIGVVNYTGLGFVLTTSIVQLAKGNVYLLLFIIAAVAMILGMGMPTAPVYVLLATLLGPALIQLGIGVMAGHLFIQYMGMLSLFTPPVAFAAFAAAAIAGADPMRTGYTAMRLGIIAYIVPFVFVFSPALLMMDSIGKIIFAMITSALGCLLVGIALTGYLFQKISIIKRVLMTLASLGLFIPIQQRLSTIGLIANILGGILGLSLIWSEWRNKTLFERKLLNSP